MPAAGREPIEVLAEGKFLRLVKRGRWEYVQRTNTSDAVVIVAVTPEKKLLLVEQFRVPLGRSVIELPAGLVGDVAGQEHEALLIAAERELLEETGYRAGRLAELASGTTTAGLADEIVTFVLARELSRQHDGGGDDHEQIIVHEVPLAEITERLKAFESSGRLVDTKIYTGLYFLNRADQRLP